MLVRDKRICLDSYSKNLVSNINIPQKTYNIVVSAGGLKGNYGTGVLSHLCHIYLKKKININKIYGASAGAVGGVAFLLCTEYPQLFNPTDAIDLHYINKRIYYEKKQKITDSFMDEMYKRFPKDFYKKCSNKLYTTVSKITSRGFERIVINEYHSNEHLRDVVRASANVPFITTKNFFTKIYDDYYFDGISPKIIDCDNFDYIYIDNMNVEYSSQKSIEPSDRCFESLVLKGIVDCHLMMQYNDCGGNVYINKMSNSSWLSYCLSYCWAIINFLIYIIGITQIIKFFFWFL